MEGSNGLVIGRVDGFGVLDKLLLLLEDTTTGFFGTKPLSTALSRFTSLFPKGALITHVDSVALVIFPKIYPCVSFLLLGTVFWKPNFVRKRKKLSVSQVPSRRRASQVGGGKTDDDVTIMTRIKNDKPEGDIL